MSGDKYKIMNNKTSTLLITGLAIVLAFSIGWTVHAPSSPSFSGTSVFNASPYTTGNDTVITCSASTSTLMIGAVTGTPRLAYSATDGGGFGAFICKTASGCTSSTAGNYLNANGGSFTQEMIWDGYKGAYSCIADGTSTKLYTSPKQN